AVTAEAVLAHSAAYLLHKYLARRAGGETIRPVSAWSQVFKVDLRGQPTVVHVRVRLTGGIVYSGTVAHYTPSIELADRELVLAPPLYVKVGDKPRTQLPLEYRRVAIRGAL